MEDLNELARKAREQLEAQKENIYDELIDEQNNIAETEIYSADDIKIKHVDYIEEPTLPNADTIEEPPGINNYDSPIFPEGPLESEVNSWKKQFQGYRVCVVEIDGDMFVFRTLNRTEYKDICSLVNSDALQREELICRECTLWPSNYTCRKMANDRAGVPSIYAQIIMENSGFTKDFSLRVL